MRRVKLNVALFHQSLSTVWLLLSSVSTLSTLLSNKNKSGKICIARAWNVNTVNGVLSN